MNLSQTTLFSALVLLLSSSAFANKEYDASRAQTLCIPFRAPQPYFIAYKKKDEIRQKSRQSLRAVYELFDPDADTKNFTPVNNVFEAGLQQLINEQNPSSLDDLTSLTLTPEFNGLANQWKQDAPKYGTQKPSTPDALQLMLAGSLIAMTLEQYPEILFEIFAEEDRKLTEFYLQGFHSQHDIGVSFPLSSAVWSSLDESGKLTMQRSPVQRTAFVDNTTELQNLLTTSPCRRISLEPWTPYEEMKKIIGELEKSDSQSSIHHFSISLVSPNLTIDQIEDLTTLLIAASRKNTLLDSLTVTASPQIAQKVKEKFNN